MSEPVWIVRVVSEETFKGLITCYVGPFRTAEEAADYVAYTVDEDVDAYVERLWKA